MKQEIDVTTMNLLPTDWCLLADAQEYYQKQYYHYIEMPWFYTDVYWGDQPEGSVIYEVANQEGMCLVASGEQSMVERALVKCQGESIKPRQKYMTITPCFRHESSDIHFPQFMKLELGTYLDFSEGRSISECEIKDTVKTYVYNLFRDALGFFLERGFRVYGSSEMISSVFHDTEFTFHFNKQWTYWCTGDVKPTFSNYDASVIDVIGFKKESDDKSNTIELGSYGFRILDTDRTKFWVFGTGLALPRASMAVTREKGELLQQPGYHLREIAKGEIGEASKIVEEMNEFLDGVEQQNKILQMIELSDLIGAIELYAESKLGSTLKDIIEFKDITKRAFESGH